jgi:hypothetical protein
MKPKQSTDARSRLLQRTKELGLDLLDHENTLWMFCPAGKVFDFGDIGYHYLFNEYGKRRSKFMSQALGKRASTVPPGIRSFFQDASLCEPT